MSESDHNAAEVIAAYRRRRERLVPLILGGVAVVLLVFGLVLIVLWLSGDNPPQLPALFATDTPTATETATPPPPSDTPTTTLTPTITETPTPSGPVTYRVQEGDSLFSIAEQFEIDLDLLLAYNPELSDPSNIFVGQEVIIPPPGAEAPTATPIPTGLAPGTELEYRVRAGDTLETIAALFNSTAEAIAEANEIEEVNQIQVGQILIVPVNIATPTPTFTPDPNTPTATLVP